MTALVMLARGEFRVLYWCRPMPACISGNKLWHPDGYLIWCPRTGFRPAQTVDDLLKLIALKSKDNSYVLNSIVGAIKGYTGFDPRIRTQREELACDIASKLQRN